jgi:hypothetical protein
MEIPIRNKEKKIIHYLTVSSEDYEELNKFKWSRDKDNYSISNIDGKLWRIHRYIMINILKNNLTPQQKVDHINRNKLDNRRENLRVVTSSENSRNRTKKKNATSKYFGVCLIKINNKWRASIVINGKTLNATYDKEIHAAYHYNIWIDTFELKSANRNNIEIPDDFILHKPKEKKENLPKYIDKQRNKYRVQLKEFYGGEYTELDSAIDALNELKIVYHENENKKLLSHPIIYNINNQCIFKINDIEVLIDEELYYDIIKYTWQVNKNNYINGRVNGKTLKLHRYIMDYTGDDCVDHINGNKLDNRRCNLRIVTCLQNSMNKLKSANCSSKYIGVTYAKDRNKWRAFISVNGEKKHLGQYINEIDAAKARDNATKIYFKEYGKLNFPD